jgi:periplasmic protein TonB
MFADSLYDSGLGRHSRRSWTTLISFGLQALAASVLLTLPLLSTRSLPPLVFAAHLMVPISTPAVPVKPAAPATGAAAVAGHSVIVAPDHISKGFRRDDADVAPDPFLGQSNSPYPSFPAGIAGSTGNSMPVLSAASVTHAPRVSVMMEGNLIRRVQPRYPPLAIQTHTQGVVVLRAVISREGNIENLQLLGGPPMLVKAAIEAVRQWHYQPYHLNHEAIEVDTQITVNFTLGGG